MSKSEQMTYKMEPAGHESVPNKRKYEKPESRLIEVFENWFRELPSAGKILDEVLEKREYDKAVEMTKEIRPTFADANALLLAYQDRPKIKSAGLFVSALYNRVKERELLFDLDLPTPVNYLGFKLPKDKVLINKSKVGSWFGYDASGPVINYGQAQDHAGCGSKGLVANYGITVGSLGLDSSGLLLNLGKTSTGFGILSKGIAANFGTAAHFFGDEAHGILINAGRAEVFAPKMPQAIMIALENPIKHGHRLASIEAKYLLDSNTCKKLPKLVNYINNLWNAFEDGIEDYHKVLAAFEKVGPAAKIRQDISDILRKGGWNV